MGEGSGKAVPQGVSPEKAALGSPVNHDWGLVEDGAYKGHWIRWWDPRRSEWCGTCGSESVARYSTTSSAPGQTFVTAEARGEGVMCLDCRTRQQDYNLIYSPGLAKLLRKLK